jgi:lipopolysaccharide export system ATP-binding protein
MEPILKATGLRKTFYPFLSYSGRTVVDGVSFLVEPGEIVGLLGPNGAGKTTCFRMVCGMIDPDEGQVLLNGLDVTDWPMFQRARDGGMGYLAQEQSYFRGLTVEQNLLAVMELLGMDSDEQAERCDELLDQFGIEKLRHAQATTLSGGEKRRLEIARCLVSDPDIILLDEPFAAIDPVTVDEVQDVILDLREEGISFLITDHNVEKTLEITDHSYIIREGQVLCAGTKDEVFRNPDAIRYYFGDLAKRRLDDEAA